MPARDINVRRETARRAYRKKAALKKEDDKAIEELTDRQWKEARPYMEEARERLRVASLGGWVSPDVVNNIFCEYSSMFSQISTRRFAWAVGVGTALGNAHEVGVFMGSAPFYRDGEAAAYFKKRVPKTQRMAHKAELLILTTAIRFINKGYRTQIFDERELFVGARH